ncbi:YktB family protein [Bacillus sp. 2205SS5-2]|uniref:YktB family protein n=1 Tax=Bacillus sp. 2205SS5-2 TaxID=3109031 RepID=UPI0030055CAD
MSFNGFKEEDFDVFQLEGLEPRMEALISTIRPKLEALGEHFAPTLSSLTGNDMYYHVAKHARRTINPPQDTWVAFANNKRGYKQHPHFQIGLWGTHVFIWFAVIYEAPFKKEYASTLLQKINEINSSIPSDFVWSSDHTKPNVIKMSDMNETELIHLFHRLQTVKKAELLCGVSISRNKAVSMSSDDWMNVINHAFVKLLPLYQMT